MADIADFERQIADFSADKARVEKLHNGDVDTVHAWRALNHDLAAAKEARNQGAADGGFATASNGDREQAVSEIDRLMHSGDEAARRFRDDLGRNDEQARKVWRDLHQLAYGGLTTGDAALLQSTDSDFHL